jgi:uncharacterized repeat protein (TIGR02543 family)
MIADVTFDSFTVASAAIPRPTATTNAANSVTATGATLNGSVNDNGAITTVTFDYGLTTGYGTNVAATTGGTVSAGAGNTAVAKSLTGLTCNTTYHFRVNGVNSAGTTNGSDLTFTTSACTTGPTATTSAAGTLGQTGATLNGSVTDVGANVTNIQFEYGPTTGYGTTVAASNVTTITATAGMPSTVSSLKAITGLTCNSTYHFRVKATDANTITNGSDATFTTSACIYTVTFDANGGSGTMSAQTASSATALTTNSFTRTGYTFAGWNTVAGGTGTAYANGASYLFTSSITLYAQWTINSYTVTPSGLNVTVTPSVAQTTSGSTIRFSVNPNWAYATNSAVTGTCPAGSWTGNVYTTGTLIGDCTVSFSGTASSFFTPTSIAGGGYHTVALKSDGTVWAWGYNRSGQLGDNTTTNRWTPVQVSGLTGVTAIAGGGYHTVALKSDGTVWAWGYNEYGQLGDNTQTQRLTPVQVSGLTGVTAIAGGKYHSVAIKSDGTVWAWGSNSGGQIGDGTTTSRSIPVPVSVLTGVTAIAGGGYHSVAIKSDGTVWAWGLNLNGALGDNSTINRWTPVQTSLLNLASFTTGSLAVTISPAEAVTAGAKWSVDGGAFQPSGAIVSGLSAGPHTVSFNTATGYTSPSNQTVTITAGQTATATGNYSTFAGSGSLTVTITPASAVTAGATWSVDGGTPQASGATVTGLAAGDHTVSYNAVTGWAPPVDKVVTLTSGTLRPMTFNYKPVGSLTVNILPSALVSPGGALAGARWGVDGGDIVNASGSTVANLPPGSHLVSFSQVAGYTEPSFRAQIVSGPLVKTGTYTKNYTVTATASGGTVTSRKSVVVDPNATDPANRNATFTVRVSAGYTTTPPTVGGTCAAGTFGTWANGSATYTITSVADACTVSFTFVGKPAAITVTAATVTQVTAKLIGSVNPRNSSTAVTFEYGADTNYGTTVSAGTLTGNSANSVSAQVTGLDCGTAYHFRVVAVNAVDTARGLDRVFSTSRCLAPVATTGNATNIGSATVTLNGKVNPKDASTAVKFEYVADAGTTPPSTYGMSVSVAETQAGGGLRPVSAQATGLTCNTKYHFRIVAVDNNASSPTPVNGTDATFTTKACPVADFNGDGMSDILFRDAVSGQTQTWLMNGATRTSQVITNLNAGPYTDTTGLHAVGIGDFNGDGKNDVLWQNAVTGALTIWKTIDGTAVEMPVVACTGCTIGHPKGIGDFDGDGMSDILFSKNGWIWIWFMHGNVAWNETIKLRGGIPHFLENQQGIVGDFNGDGMADVLSIEAAPGSTFIILGNGTGTLMPFPVGEVFPVGWQVQGIGDFNGDGMSDILWRDSTTGDTFIWFMNGGRHIGDRAFTSLQPGLTTGWQVQAVGDYNGDGKADILWRYASTGNMVIWFMNGAAVTADWTSAWPGVYTSTTGWQVISAETIR